MDEIETALRDWGRKWRESQGPIPELDLAAARARRSSGFKFGWRSMSSVGGIVGLVGVVVVVMAVVTSSSISKSGPTAGWLQDGTQVRGVGWLIEVAAGQVELCLGGFGRSDGGPVCSDIAVSVEGVRWADVPGAKRADDRLYADSVEVRGLWTGTAIAARSITAGPESRYPAAPYPCGNDFGDSQGLGSSAEEQALGALGNEVFGDPDYYAGLWRAASPDGVGRIVVEIKGDLAAAGPKLRELYPYPLCLHPARFSESDLSATLGELGRASPNWRAEVNYPRNGVQVSVVSLTSNVQVLLEPFGDQIVVDELLMPD